MNQKTLLGSHFVFTNQSSGDITFSAGPNENLILNNVSIASSNVKLSGPINQGTFLTGVATKILNSNLPTQSGSSSDMFWNATSSQLELNRIGASFLIQFFMAFSINASGSRELYFEVNGNPRNNLRIPSQATQNPHLLTSIIIPAISSQTIVTFWVSQDSGATLQISGNGVEIQCQRLG